jgi:hypothetical protein
MAAGIIGIGLCATGAASQRQYIEPLKYRESIVPNGHMGAIHWSAYLTDGDELIRSQ